MKYAMINLLLGAVLVFQGVQFSGARIALFWLGGCFVVMGLAYLLRWHGVFGKRSDGTLAWWSWVVFLPFHLYMHGVWHLLRWLSREHPLDGVTSNIVVGRRLLGSELPNDFAAVVDLTAEFAEPVAIRSHPGYRALPLLDATAPSSETELRRFIESIPDGRIFIHCAQGHGRTGLFALSFLVLRGICSTFDEAAALLLASRPGIRLNSERRAFIQTLTHER